MPEDEERPDPKAHADVPPVLPQERPRTSGSGGVLSPEDLDISESPYVVEVSEGRFVVSADRTPDVPAEVLESADDSIEVTPTESTNDPPAEEEKEPPHDATGQSAGEEPTDPSNTNSETSPGSPAAARSILEGELEANADTYGLDVVSTFDERSVQYRTTTDDPVQLFNSLVLWYAQHLAPGTPTHRTISQLLVRSEFTPPPTADTVHRAVARHDLDETDTIEDLLDAME